LAPSANNVIQKTQKLPIMMSPTNKPKCKTEKCFLIESRRLPESVEGWNSSPAQSAGELWLKCTGHHSDWRRLYLKGFKAILLTNVNC